MTVASLVTWDGHTAGALAHRCAVPHVELFNEIGSTLDVAHTLAESGAPPGTVILADSQLAGRGQLGRSWISEAGRGVWCTVIERLRDTLALDVLSLRVGLRVAAALDRFAPRQLELKWPNDLLLGREKLGGVLVESRWKGTTLEWLAIGVGVNVRPPRDVAGGGGLRVGVQRADVLAAIVPAIRAAAASGGHLTHDELERFRARDALAGRRVTSPSAGTVVGIDDSGALLVRDEAGRVASHRTGSVRLEESS